VALLRQIQPPRRRPHAGKVLGLVKTDAPEAVKGKPCGASHIAKGYKCGKATQDIKNDNIKAWAAVGISAAAVAGIATVLFNQSKTRKAILAQLPKPLTGARGGTQEEYDSIYNYVLSSYGVNRNLRSGKPLDDRAQTIINGLDSYLANSPGTQGTYYRGISLANSKDPSKAQWINAKAGDIINDQAYTSFSSDRQAASLMFARGSGPVVVYKGSLVQLPYDKPNSYGKTLQGDLESEKEFLVPRNSTYRVVRTEEIPAQGGLKGSKQRIIYVELSES
jgi:hypothetical protein